MLFKVILHHMYTLMTFKNDGKNLKSSQLNSYLMAIVSLFPIFFISLFSFSELYLGVLVTIFFNVGLVFVFFIFSDNTIKINGLILIISFVKSVNVLVWLLFGEEFAKIILLPILIWEIFAMVIFLKKIR